MDTIPNNFSEASSLDIVINSSKLLIGFFALFGNFFIVVLWICCKTLRVKRNSFLISLSIGNILTSVIAIPFTTLVREFTTIWETKKYF